MHYQILLTILILLSLVISVMASQELIFSVNAAGDAHVASNGIFYSKDFSNEGEWSFFHLNEINGVDPRDFYLYKTQRWSTFKYEIYLGETDGEYLLVMKFAELAWTSMDQRMFDVFINGKHKIISDLDVIKEVGANAPCNKEILFSVTDNGSKLIVLDESSQVIDGKITVEFVKGKIDQPHLCAMHIMRITSFSIADTRTRSYESTSKAIHTVTNYLFRPSKSNPFTVRIITVDDYTSNDDFAMIASTIISYPLITLGVITYFTSSNMEYLLQEQRFENLNFFTIVLVPIYPTLQGLFINLQHYIYRTINVRKDVIVFVSPASIASKLKLDTFKHSLIIDAFTGNIHMKLEFNQKELLQISNVNALEIPSKRMGGNIVGRHLLVQSFEYIPYTYLFKPAKANATAAYTGIHYRILAASAKTFNFTFSLAPNDNWDVHLFSPFYPGGIDKARLTWTSSMRFVVGHPKRDFPKNALFLPLQKDVWIGCLIVFGVIVVAIGISSCYQNRSHILQEIGILPFSLVMEQGLIIPSHLRLLSLTLLVGCTVLVTGYRSTLRQHLMFPKPAPIPRTFEELAEMEHYKVTLCSSETDIYQFQTSHRPALRILGYRLVHGYYQECAIKCLEQLILDYNISCVSWDDILITEAAKMVHLNFTVDPLIYSTDDALNGKNSLGFQRNSIYTDGFSKILAFTGDMGIFLKWWEEDMDNLKKSGREKLIAEKSALFYKLLELGRKQDEKKPLTLNNLKMVLLFLPCGLIFAFIFFFIEILTLVCKACRRSIPRSCQTFTYEISITKAGKIHKINYH